MMRKYVLTIGVALVCTAGLGTMMSQDAAPQAQAQPTSKGSKAKKTGNVKTLDVRAQKLEAEFARGSVELARDYEAAGELEKARQVYSALSRLNPGAKEIQDRLKSIDEAILAANAFEADVDTSAGWGVPLARVTQGKPFKVQAGGTYRFQANLPVGPDGFAVADPVKSDLAEDVRCGALMGLIVTNGKPGKPFAVGADSEINPRSDGLLYLRVNVPAGSKCTGELKVRLGGNVERN